MSKLFDEKSILNRNKIYDVPAGTMILREGEINFDMYKIVSGHVEMYTGYGTDSEVLIGIFGAGTCFGEFGILTGKPAIYTIITYSKTKLLRVTEALMGTFIQENPEDAIQIMKNMANNMSTMQHQIVQLSTELVEQSEYKEEIAKAVTLDIEKAVEEYLKKHDLLKDNLKSYVLNPAQNDEDKTPEENKTKGVGMRFYKYKNIDTSHFS
ncbi:Crp/Fnr family transcriptional regulator [Pseudobutyrivibrio sp. MD2005]|uniref:Crp/Fnr family transcriptional regulator n=1 Tax=Pseudobutyrivibrio sp. MD2005 TaxID=1410616 RepID=UPI000480C469|nr:Crp/Fnr family transcriptional regulator [Pseudobutyrivibrio sp. MD2005]